MNKPMRRITGAAVSAAIAGGAILGASGSASAATLGADRHDPSPTIVVQAVSGERLDGGEHGGWYRHGYDHGQHYGWDGHRGWHYSKDRHGDWYWYSYDRGQNYRWDGHRLYRWHEDRWIIVIQVHEYGISQWYLDQLTFVGD
ncbi:hypothetical protein ABZ746_37375 [Streptomyces sp. NPDC020096]